jgi:ectoine hydroxylase-related dioxygenase (phytanoyl-CoA dioxygenase family)
VNGFTTSRIYHTLVAKSLSNKSNNQIPKKLSTRITQLLFSPNPQNVTDNDTPYHRYIMTSSSSSSYPTEMTDKERYLFDLNGYLIVKNVLSLEEVQHANHVIDQHSHKIIERSDPTLRNAIVGSTMYGTGPGRKDLGQILEWGKDDSSIFASILNHPRLVPIFHGILGKGYRMDHLPFCILQDYGAEGFQLHGGTIDCVTGDYNPHLAYTCHHNTIRTALLGCSLILTDHNAGDGGFCVVPGSHKSNFQMPPGMIDGTEEYEQYIHQPITKAGDVVLFSEGTVHGAMPWTCQTRQRRICLYRFSPATNAYGRSYFGSHTIHEDGNDNTTTGSNDKVMGWPKAMYDGLTEGQRAVLEPPYANRLDRPNIQDYDTNSTIITTRNERKKKHDRDVFGTKYF